MSVMIEPPYPAIDQTTILDKCLKYLKIQSQKYPEKYKGVESLLQSVASAGHCKGFSALWLYAKSEETEDLLYSVLRRISIWDEKEETLRAGANKSHPDGRLAETFEQFINDIRWAYELEKMMAWPLNTDYLEQMNSIVKQEGAAPIVNEFSTSFVFKKDELIETLKQVIFDDRLISLNSTDHTIGVMKKNGYYYVYDSNYRFNPRNPKDPNYKAGYDGKAPVSVDSLISCKFDTVEGLEAYLEACFFFDSIDPETKLHRHAGNMPIYISTFRKEEILASAILDKKRNENELVQMIKTVIPNNTKVTVKHGNKSFYIMFKNGSYYLYKSKNDVEPYRIFEARNKNLSKEMKQHEAAVRLSIFLDNEFSSLELDKHFTSYFNTPKKRRKPIFVYKSGPSAKYPSPQKLKSDFIKRNNDINRKSWDGYSSLAYAAMIGDINGLKMLITSGIDLNTPNTNTTQNPLLRAAINGQLEALKILLAAKADISIRNKKGGTLLMSAIHNRRKEVVKILLAAKADISAVDNNGFSALHYAAQDGHLDIVKILLDAKADVSTRSELGGYTPLMSAAQNGHHEVVKALIKANADFSVYNDEGITPLHLAVFKGHKEVVKTLIEAKIDLSKGTKQKGNMEGATALMFAANLGKIEIVKLLIAAGANIDDKDKAGMTAFNYAAGGDQPEVVKILKEAKANLEKKEELEIKRPRL